MKNFTFLLAGLLFSLFAPAQKKWDGGGGNNLWSTGSNWQPDGIPSASDEVILDNTIITATYTVQLPSGSVQTMVNTLQITPSGINTITLELPSGNVLDPGLQITGSADALVLNNGAILKNSSGAATGNGIVINNTFRINNGGRYIHNTTRGNANLINQLSSAVGTENGIFEFDVPGTAGYTLSLTGNNFGSLVFSAIASGGTRSYSGGGASPLTIRGNLIVNAGTSVTSTMTADILVSGNLVVNGNLNLNPTTSGVINRSLLFNGTGNQIISGTGNISPGSNFRNMEVGNSATVVLQRNLAMTNPGNNFQVNANGNLQTGVTVIGGNGSFVLAPDGLLSIGSPDGITLSSAAGNIQTTIRNFSTGGNYEYNGSGEQNSGNGLPANINTLMINKSSGDLTMTTSTKIQGILNLNQGRILTMDNNLITITSTTSIFSPLNNYGNINEGWEQSFVSGPMLLENNSTVTKIIPVGKNDRFAPVKIKKGNPALVIYKVEYFPLAYPDITTIANPPLDHVSSLEHWGIQTNVSSNDDDAQVTLSWRPGSGVGSTDAERADLCMAHYENRGNGLKWEREGADPVITGNSSYGFITSDNLVAAFSPFTLASKSTNNVLPWKLLSFEALPGKGRNQVNWKISGEAEVVNYFIARSTDGQIFRPLDTILPEHKKTVANYSFFDLKPHNGWNYYRLAISDQKNSIDYSPIVKVYFTTTIMHIYPNPVRSNLEIYLSSPRSRYKLDIVNNIGQVIKRYISLPNHALNVDDLNRGFYYIRVYNENETVTRSFIKL